MLAYFEKTPCIELAVVEEAGRDGMEAVDGIDAVSPSSSKIQTEKDDISYNYKISK